MPLLSVVWFLLCLCSLAVWGGAGYLLWSWHEGDIVRNIDGALVRERENWRLWAGLALFAWSLLGRLVVAPLIARPDAGPRQFRRGGGRIIKCEEGALYVEERGPPGAPVIVLTHGQGVDSTIWAEISAQLAQRFRVIAWDLPGAGRSKRSHRDLSPGAAARALAAVMREFRVRGAVLVGHSFGGMTLQEFAKTEAELFRDDVAGLVLLHTTYTDPVNTMALSGVLRPLQKPLLEPVAHLTIWLQPLVWLNAWQSYLSGWAHVANRLQFGPSVTRALLEHTTFVATRSPPAAIERRNLGMYHWSGAPLEEIDKPTLVVAGDADIITKREAGEALARRIRQARLHVVPRANHMTPFERAASYAETISSFADGIASRSAVS